MKVFWAIIGVLALATVALLASGRLGGRGDSNAAKQPHSPVPAPLLAPPAAPEQFAAPIKASTQKTSTPGSSDEPAAQPASVQDGPSKPVLPPPLPIAEKAPPVAPPAPAAPPTVQAPSAPPAVQTPPHSPAAQPSEAPKLDPPGPAAKPDVKPATDTTAPAESKTPKETSPKPATAPSADPEDPNNPLIQLKKEIEAQRAAEAAAKAAATSAEKPAPSAPTTATKIPAAPAASAPAAGAKFSDTNVEIKPDGSMLVDGKYVVKGKGTKEDPYKVTWDHLVSAQNEYAPKDGRKNIPPRIMALNDTWVDITGYVAFPLMSAESDELLSMMNQWDGCCIGIPPTPYDAIEVRLVSPVSGNARLTTYGGVRGKLKIDPHLVGGWLVGLYVMDQATLTPVSYGGIAP